MITIAPADDLTIVRELITEYANALGVDLSFQDLDHELSTLATFYELILLAREDDRAAGCVALRRIDDDTCEMKHLYVSPAFRGINLGRQLAERIIDAGRERGYKRMRLDTLPTMAAAIPLYTRSASSRSSRIGSILWLGREGDRPHAAIAQD